MFTLRLATVCDAPLLPAIERGAAQAFCAIDGLAWLADAEVMSVERHRQLIALGDCWVALDAGGQLQGFISAQRFGDALHVHELSVTQAAQGQGLGRQLMGAVMHLAQSRRLREVTLTTFCDVPWNAPFYRRLGFETVLPGASDSRLAALLREEYGHGFAPGSRCAMRWPVPSV
ncbi:MAG: dTDP-fucosamine acetyltransferase [Pseudomonas fluorescens]|nr:MAG: dTDP-fucosamine acetyltransferase [Pseudomonas fluorescens]